MSGFPLNLLLIISFMYVFLSFVSVAQLLVSNQKNLFVLTEYAGCVGSETGTVTKNKIFYAFHNICAFVDTWISFKLK